MSCGSAALPDLGKTWQSVPGVRLRLTLGWTRIEVEVEGSSQTSKAATANGRSLPKIQDGLSLILAPVSPTAPTRLPPDKSGGRKLHTSMQEL